MNIDQDPARMIDSTEDRTRIDRKRALAVVALAAIVGIGCGKHRDYDTPDAGGDESAEAGSGAPKTSASRTTAANGGGRAPATGAAGRQSTGAAGRTGNSTGSQRGAAGGGGAGHAASGSSKSGAGDDTGGPSQSAGGASAPAADGGSGGMSSTSGDSGAGASAGAGGAADGGNTSSGAAGVSGSGDVSAAGAGAGATGEVGGAGSGGSEIVGGAGAGAGGAGAGGVGGVDNVAGAGTGGAGAGGMSGGGSGGTPAAGGGGSNATCHHDRDCSDGVICNANTSTCQHCDSDDDCQHHSGYGPYSSCAPDTRLCSGLCASCGGCDEVQTPNPDTHHTDDPVDYPDPPPTSGPHNPCWAIWGVHDMPVPDYRWVHNLEHGGIVYLYNCPDGCADDVATLSQLVMSHPRTVLTSYSKLPTRFASVAWGHRLLTSCVDVTAFTTFYNQNFDKGPESEDAQPSSSCPP
jgi:hypothetical protein